MSDDVRQTPDHIRMVQQAMRTEPLPTVVGIPAYREFGRAPILNLEANSALRLDPAMIRQIERRMQGRRRLGVLIATATHASL